MSKDDLQKTILIVDDDEVFRETLCNGLESTYTVLPAANAKDAISIIKRSHVDLLLTDVRMPGMSGFELIEWIQANLKRKIPYIAMSGYLSMEAEDEESHHSLLIVTKPFKLGQLRQMISTRINEAIADGNDKISDHLYCKIPINDIVTRSVLEFDLYIKLSENNFIKVAYRDEELPLAQMKKFKEKGVGHLYIRNDDFHKFVQFTFEVASAVTKSTEISPERKLAFLNYANKIMLEKIYNDGLDQETYAETAAFVGLSVKTVLQSGEVLNLLEVLKDTGDKVYTDSFAMALYAVLIAREMKYESALTAFKLCIAGIMQDIGKKEIDKEIVEKDASTLTIKEAAILETHVVRSQQILESLKCIHSDIIRMIQEHHEDMDGRGYPFSKKKSEQHPLSRILQCSNVFIEKINTYKSRTGRIDVAFVISDLEKNYKTRLDPDCVKALRSLFKLPAIGAEVL